MKKSSVLLGLFLLIPACVLPTTNPSPSPSGSSSSSPSASNSVIPSATSSASPGSSFSLNNGLIAYFPFNGNAADESGNAVSTSVEGASLTKDRFGADNKAYSFNGTSNFIKANIDINSSKYPNLTITAWVRSVSQDITKKSRMVVSQDNGGYDRSLGIDFRGGGSGWSAFAGSGVLGFKPVEKDKWTFLAVVYDQSKKTVDLYVNQEKISRTNSETDIGNTFLRIGSNPGYGQYFQGDIDQVRIYNRSLAENEINTVYNAAE